VVIVYGEEDLLVSGPSSTCYIEVTYKRLQKPIFKFWKLRRLFRYVKVSQFDLHGLIHHKSGLKLVNSTRLTFWWARNLTTRL